MEMMNVYDDDLKDEETQMSIFKRQISQSDLIESLQTKLLKLEDWQREVGYPAIEENDKLKITVLEYEQKEISHTTEMLALKQENDTMQIALDTFQEEHNKWELERTELMLQLNEATHERQASKIEEQQWAKSVEEQYHKIDKLTRYRRKSRSDLQLSQRTIAELLQENGAMTARMEELKLVNTQSNQTMAELNEKYKDLQLQYNELQNKHEILNSQYLTEKEKSQKMVHALFDKQINQTDTNDETPTSVNSNNYISPIAKPIAFNPKTLSISQNSSVKDIYDTVHQVTDRLSNDESTSPNSPKVDMVRRRSRSLDSDGFTDRVLMHHMDGGHHIDSNLSDFDDEKEAFDTNDDEHFDEHKLRTEMNDKYEQILMSQRQEIQEMNDKYETLQRKHEQLRNKYDRRSQFEESTENQRRLVNDVYSERSQRAMQEDKKSSCWLFPWTCNNYSD